MAHHAIKRLGPTGLIAIFVALTMSLVGAGAAIAAAGSPSKAKGPVVAHTKAGKMKAPITGTTVKGDRKVKGTFTPSEFKAVDDALVVTGTLKGKIYGKGAPKAFEKEITKPVKDASSAHLPRVRRSPGATSSTWCSARWTSTCSDSRCTWTPSFSTSLPSRGPATCSATCCARSPACWTAVASAVCSATC